MNELEKSVLETIKGSDLSSLSQDYAELFIDSIIKDGVLKDIPVIQTIIALTKTGIGIKNLLFTKKIIRFLFSLKDTNLQERTKMILELESDPAFNGNVGEHVILLLDKYDDMKKPVLMGNAFSAYIQKRINALELRKMNFGIDNLFMPNISYLKQFYLDLTKELPEDIHQNLSLCGFVDLVSAFGGLAARKNKLGELFIKEVVKDIV